MIFFGFAGGEDAAFCARAGSGRIPRMQLRMQAKRAISAK
jgi:hypothetical protein